MVIRRRDWYAIFVPDGNDAYKACPGETDGATKRVQGRACLRKFLKEHGYETRAKYEYYPKT